jgi:hypothetical protein
MTEEHRGKMTRVLWQGRDEPCLLTGISPFRLVHLPTPTRTSNLLLFHPSRLRVRSGAETIVERR